jgi:hypothetical protein
MGVVSIVWYVAVNELSQNVLGDSVTAIGFMIAFYYGITGLACTWYYRRAIFRSAKNFVLAGLFPLLGFAMLAFVFVRAYIDYGTKGYDEDFNYTKPWHGIEIPILIGIGGLLLGVVLMVFAGSPIRGSSGAGARWPGRPHSRSRRRRRPLRWSRAFGYAAGSHGVPARPSTSPPPPSGGIARGGREAANRSREKPQDEAI